MGTEKQIAHRYSVGALACLRPPPIRDADGSHGVIGWL